MLPENGEPTVLEVNTIPGMTEASLLPEAAAAAGISYAELCARIIELSRARRGGREMKSSSSTRTRPRNQRVSNPRQRRQQHLLDVKVRSHKATQHRNRRVLVFVSKIALAAAICAGSISACGWGAKRLFFENPDYRLSQIEVQTDGTLQRDQILKTAGLREGENIFSVNLAQVHDRLQQLPQVDEVQVVRKMPAKSTFASSSASRSPGSRPTNKSPIHLRPTSLFWWTRAAF